LCQQQFCAQDSALAPYEEGQKVKKGQTFLDHTYPAVFFRRKGRCVQSLVQIGSEIWIFIRYKLTNKQNRRKNHFNFIHKIQVKTLLDDISFKIYEKNSYQYIGKSILKFMVAYR
jgi:hypothetical protein